MGWSPEQIAGRMELDGAEHAISAESIYRHAYNAEVEVWRVNWANTGQRVLMRRGAIGQIRRGRLAFVAEVRSLAHMLGQTVGRTFQATCDAALGDARCGVDLEDPASKGPVP